MGLWQIVISRDKGCCYENVKNALSRLHEAFRKKAGFSGIGVKISMIMKYHIGDKQTFGMDMVKFNSYYKMSLYVGNKDILQFCQYGKLYPFRWDNLDYIVEWFEDNINNILQDDIFPIEDLMDSKDSAVNLAKHIYNIESEDQRDLVQEWMFRHAWMTARAGSFLANVYFRSADNKIEISWDNTETYARDGVMFVYPKGEYKIEKEHFSEVIQNFITCYKKIH